MAPPEFSRRRRRWVHHPGHKEAMRCFTDEEITRGLQRVIDLVEDHEAATSDWLEIFLQAAQPTSAEAWPMRHPMTCARCGRTITDASGTALVEILITDSAWRCVQCASAVH